MIIQLQIRYLVFIPYLIFVGMLDGNILAESIVIGLALAIYDYFFDNGG